MAISRSCCFCVSVGISKDSSNGKTAHSWAALAIRVSEKCKRKDDGLRASVHTHNAAYGSGGKDKVVTRRRRPRERANLDWVFPNP
jgi:hypothetical protein